MHDVPEPLAPDLPTAERYAELRARALALVAGESDAVANLANVAAEVFASVPDLNWAGFYLLKGGELVVGPFQGRPACVRIAVGRGVCGMAVAERRSQVVADVHAFDGHIACDPRSRAEIVVPIESGGLVVGRPRPRQRAAGAFRRRRPGRPRSAGGRPRASDRLGGRHAGLNGDATAWSSP